MICVGCADAADAQHLLIELSERGEGLPADAPSVLHPSDCGCACRHRLAGSVRFDVK